MQILILCIYFFYFTLHVSGSHKPIIRGVSSCFLYTTIWFMWCLCCSSACACGLVCRDGFTLLQYLRKMHGMNNLKKSIQNLTLCSMQQLDISVRYTEKPRYNATDCPPQFVAVYGDWR